MKITIETILHDQQRYPTVGDWFYDQQGNLTIRISDLEDWRYNALVGVHELVEVLLCRARNITQAQVDAFDFSFKEDGEPGDQPSAPYQNEHNFATGIERLLCAALKIPWQQYENKVNSV